MNTCSRQEFEAANDKLHEARRAFDAACDKLANENDHLEPAELRPFESALPEFTALVQALDAMYAVIPGYENWLKHFEPLQLDMIEWTIWHGVEA